VQRTLLYGTVVPLLAALVLPSLAILAPDPAAAAWSGAEDDVRHAIDKLRQDLLLVNRARAPLSYAAVRLRLAALAAPSPGASR
jgi:hypothetical protein